MTVELENERQERMTTLAANQLLRQDLNRSMTESWDLQMKLAALEQQVAALQAAQAVNTPQESAVVSQATSSGPPTAGTPPREVEQQPAPEPDVSRSEPDSPMTGKDFEVWSRRSNTCDDVDFQDAEEESGYHMISGQED